MTTNSSILCKQLSQSYWAKYDNETGQMHRLEHHLADVGAVMKALLHVPSIARTTAKAGNLTSLDTATTAPFVHIRRAPRHRQNQSSIPSQSCPNVAARFHRQPYQGHDAIAQRER